MAALDQTGVMQVNGAWATRVTYEADVVGPRVGIVDVRFMQGRSEIARVSLTADQVTETLGPKNSAAIARHVATDADKYLPTVRGELRGARLHYGEVNLPSAPPRVEENSVGAARDRRFAAEPQSEKTTPTTESQEPLPTGAATSVPPPASTAAPETPNAKTRQNVVPEHIAAKYVVQGDRYHFDDQTVAFIDQGSRLTVQTQNTAVLKDLIEIAQARDWQAVTLTGTQSFRREAWREATAAGLSVTGYTPSAVERAAAERDRERRARVQAGARDGHDAAGSSEERRTPTESTLSAAARSRAAGRSGNASQGIAYGTLVDHGNAPYQHDQSQAASYFVTLRDDAGRERTHWGVGLEEAITVAQSQPTLGDRVGVQRVGSTPVTVRTRSAGSDGEVAEEHFDTQRHQWRVEREAFLKGNNDAKAEAISATPSDGSGVPVSAPTKNVGPVGRDGALTRDQEIAAAIRSAETTREELQLKYPQLNQAVFQHLASHDQFAEAYVKAGLIRESDRAQVIAQMRERLASQLEQGRTLREPDGKQVDTLIRRSVNRVAADIGRPVVEVRAADAPVSPKPLVREEAQVRA